jgi:hypothetical protein
MSTRTTIAPAPPTYRFNRPDPRFALHVGVILLGIACGLGVAGWVAGMTLTGWMLGSLYLITAWLGGLNLLAAYDIRAGWALRRHIWIYRLSCLVLTLHVVGWTGLGLVVWWW